MRLRTDKKTAFGNSFSFSQVSVSHSVKKTYKGSKIARVQNQVENLQAGAIDNKIKWDKHKEQRKRERKQRQEGIN